MKKQAMVIGLGTFGMSLARELSARNVEVLAVDSDPGRVQEVSDLVADAVRFDATDEAELARAAPERRDLCICTIGQESREASIICTALLRQLGAKRVIARANEALHERILLLVGAHEVVNPEREFGRQFAHRLAYDKLRGELPLGGDLVLTELDVPESFVGATLPELKLPSKYGVTVIAVRCGNGESLELPRSDRAFERDDIVIVVSSPEAVDRLMDEA